MHTTNFSHLKNHGILFDIANFAEKYFVTDPNATLLKLRILNRNFIIYIASVLGIFKEPKATHFSILEKIKEEAYIDYKILEKLHELRKLGNDANYKYTNDHQQAVRALKLAWQLSIWFHRVYGNP